jgi:hypothetical protein
MNSKQTGMGTEAKLLYQISKQLDRLIRITAAQSNPTTTTTTTVV